MAYIIDTLSEELERLERIKISYLEKISKLPKGSIVKKRINGIEYKYLVYRDGISSPKTRYLGKNEDLDLLKKQIEQRKKLIRDVKEIDKDLKTIRKVIKK
jgi:hypothetical protein